MRPAEEALVQAIDDAFARQVIFSQNACSRAWMTHFRDVKKVPLASPIDILLMHARNNRQYRKSSVNVKAARAQPCRFKSSEQQHAALHNRPLTRFNRASS